jgi:hypothetical protein
VSVLRDRQRVPQIPKIHAIGLGDRK